MPVPEEILRFYAESREAGRLSSGRGLLEKLRTLELIEHFAPPPPAVVLDVGGAAGVYALPMAESGYEVHLVDPVPRHLEQARSASAAQQESPLASTTSGEAGDLAFEDEFADVVLLLGPLYHLPEPDERLSALREAHRCLKKGGVLFAAAISRFASLFDGLSFGLIEDPAFISIVKRDLETGRHVNPTGNPAYFTTSFFHRPDDLLAEVRRAGFGAGTLLAVEGPACAARAIDEFMADDNLRRTVLDLARTVESDRDIIAASTHIMAVGTK